MTVSNLLSEVKKLSLEEQLELYEELTRLVGPDDDLALTPAQAEDLDKRIEEYRSGKAKLIPGDEAIEQLRKRM